MTTKNDINRLFAEVIEYVKDTTTQNVVSTIQKNDNPGALLNNVTKTINNTVTQAYDRTAERFQTKLNELEQAIIDKNQVPTKKIGRTKVKK
tara:strand:- start:181 stop:456 length:276 start_codon:yes stop_codon:yes gene_type:complete